MREQEISPANWALWSSREWAKRSAPGSTPPLQWTFSVTRLVNQRPFFDEQAEELGGRIVFTAAMRELMGRYQRMAAAIRSCRTPDEARAVATAAFPEGLHQRLVERARSEAKAEQAQLWDRARKGEWIWNEMHKSTGGQS
jgi:hypothetical protein